MISRSSLFLGTNQESLEHVYLEYKSEGKLKMNSFIFKSGKLAVGNV